MRHVQDAIQCQHKFQTQIIAVAVSFTWQLGDSWPIEHVGQCAWHIESKRLNKVEQVQHVRWLCTAWAVVCQHTWLGQPILLARVLAARHREVLSRALRHVAGADRQAENFLVPAFVCFRNQISVRYPQYFGCFHGIPEGNKCSFQRSPLFLEMDPGPQSLSMAFFLRAHRDLGAVL